MEPLGAVLATVAAGAAAWFGYEKFLKPKVAPGPLPGTVGALEQGKTYAVMAQYAPPKGAFTDIDPATGKQATVVPNNPQHVADFISHFFAGKGFEVKQQPALRDADATRQFNAGLPSTWVFVAKWTKNESVVGGPGSPFIGMATFTPLPTA